jgi:hypothetical protein
MDYRLLTLVLDREGPGACICWKKGRDASLNRAGPVRRGKLK